MENKSGGMATSKFPTSGEGARPGVNRPDEIRQRKERGLDQAKGVRENRQDGGFRKSSW